MPLKIISIGKSNDALLNDAVQAYHKRLQGLFRAEWSFVPHSKLNGASALADESKRILAKIKPDDFVVLLDETGKQLTSPELSELIDKQAVAGKNIVFIIGGAYGVSESVRLRANFIWSLSNLVFPHRIVRLILIEQIYRAQTITNGQPYHHE